ncbi:MAG: LysR family transcriptional regulator, partial [Burkholderiales bacterium]|nr:LysR family transcriptional regulator [Burkholderiales bacterium]
LAVPQLLACTMLPEAMAAFASRVPEIDVRLQDCLVDQVVSRVLSGEVDFGVGPERDYSDELVAQPLFDLAFGVAFLPDHPLERPRTLRWKDLVGHPVISMQGEFTQRLHADLPPRLRNTQAGIAREVNFMTTAFAMVRAGLGVTLCLPYAQPLIELHGLRWRLLRAPVVKRKFFILHRKDRALSQAAQAFAAHLKELRSPPAPRWRR